MEIDYTVGDDVVCVKGFPPEPGLTLPVKGEVYVCVEIAPNPEGACPQCGSSLIVAVDLDPEILICSSSFKKVQLLDVAEWLKEHKPVPVKVREDEVA